MSSRRAQDAVAVAVEAQASDLRQLAHEIRHHCDHDSRFFITPRRREEIDLMRRWADDIVEIGHALTSAFADADKPGVRRLFRKSAAFSVFVAGVLGFSSDSLSLLDRFDRADPIEVCVARLVSRSEAIEGDLESSPSDGEDEASSGEQDENPISNVDEEVLALVEGSFDWEPFRAQDPVFLPRKLRDARERLSSRPDVQERLTVVIDALSSLPRPESGYGVLRIARSALERET